MRRLLLDRVALVLLAAALAVRLALALEVTRHGLDMTEHPFLDMRTIQRNAERIAAGDVLQMDQYFGVQSYYRDFFFGPERYDRLFGPFAYYDAPLHVYLLGALYRILGSPSPHAAAFLNAFLGTLTCALVYLSALRLEGRTGARCALALVALSQELVLYSGFVLRETTIALLLAWSAHELLRARDEGSEHAWMRAGLSLGLAWLAKTTSSLLFPFAAALLLLHARRRGAREGGRRAAAFALAAFLPVVPFAARNVALGVQPLTLAVGAVPMIAKQNLPEVLGAAAWGPSGVLPARTPAVIARAEEGSVLSALREAVREHPSLGSWVRQLGRKLAFYWSPLDIWDDVRVSYLRPLLASLAPCAASFALLGPLAFTGAVLALRSRASIEERLPFLAVLALGLATALLVGAFTRYSLPGHPALAVLAAAVPAELERRFDDGRWLRAAAVALAVAGAALLFDAPRKWVGPEGRAPEPERLADYVRSAFPFPENRAARRYLLEKIRREP